MVYGDRYLEYHKNEAERITKLLRQFGDDKGYSCSKHKHPNWSDCISCGGYHICRKRSNPPPLKRNYDIEAEERGRSPHGDWGLIWIWHGWRELSVFHPEVRKMPSGKELQMKIEDPELDALLGWGMRALPKPYLR